MTVNMIVNDEESEPAAKTLRVTGDKVVVLADSFEKTYARTYHDTLGGNKVDENYQAPGLTEIERELYRDKIRRERGDKYNVKGRLASGGMGTVLKVADNDLQRPIAMKIVKPEFKNNENVLQEFIREAKITGLLEHPNIIPVHEMGLSEETGLFFTMKLVVGESLNNVLRELKKGNPQYAEKYNMFYLLNIFRKICDAISFAHSKGIIHQDIKPHNVIVGQYGEVLVMDWGLARFIGNPEKEPDAFQRELLRNISVFPTEKMDAVQGSPAYMASEQVKGDITFIDRRTDIFLLGATLYHIFTLEPPYRGDSIKDVLRKAEYRELLPPEKRNPDRMIPEEICRIITKATALEKQDRYQMVEELIADLDDVTAGRWSKQEKKTFASGQYLMHQGDPGDEAYLIIRGRVQVYKEMGSHRITLSTLNQGEIVGEMALITDEKRSASVVALEDTEVAILTKQLLGRNLRKLPPYIEKMVATITHRLQMANNLIHPHLTRDCSPFVLQQLCLILRNQAAGEKKFVTYYEQIVPRIAHDLGIPLDKADEVFMKAAAARLLKINGTEIIVEDVEEIQRYISSLKA